MKLVTINSGSIGNCYLMVAENGETLIIEAGVLFKDIKKALNFNLSNVVGTIVSHQHGDHIKGLKDLCAAGMDAYCSKETIEALAFKSHRLNVIEENRTYTFGSFKVLPFPVKHDVYCFGFLIHHPECGKIIFVTDSYMVEQRFTGLNNIIIEANYCTKILDEKQRLGLIQDWRANRLYKSHMSIDTTLGLLKANDLSQVYQVVLIHLSESNSNAEEFQQRVFDQTHKKVTIAKKNLVIDFNKTPF